MTDKAQIETFIMDAAAQMGDFRHADPALLRAGLLEDFVAAGYALLNYYQGSGDTVINEDVMGIYVDAAMLTQHMANDDGLDSAAQAHAGEVCATLEALVNDFTATIEHNIAQQR
jgi:hypothetical protein